MQNYRMKIAYDGTRYLGWEHQPGRETIQGKIEQILARMCGLNCCGEDFMGSQPPFKLIASGRTDAGVHAKEQVVSVAFEAPSYQTGPWERKDSQRERRVRDGTLLMSCEQMRDYLNHYLPDDIVILELKEAGSRFHARYNARGKSYQYTIFDGAVKPPFLRKYYTAVDQTLDLAAMQAGAKYLIGEHDFKSFCGNARMKKSTVRTVDQIEIRRSKGFVYITIHGSGFLQNMVRIIVGTLLEVGRGRMAAEEVARILEACDRKQAGPTAAAKGLCLLKVDYD